ncbi:hypothetical protein POM88_033208 [Heracleum sosnowskyi]|uniref:TF-B3 domain-containing protein n=1 Tax=Heracleum sosnowskyi TaxID=360622 RepID=A0AAD8I1N1_9APIA|nr:hypothetical protein POM88_033208 [Heracleum sosnowskyi]
MDSSGLVCERFVRFLTRSDTWRNEMGIPYDFCSKYGNRLSGSLHVIVRNGYRLPVEFDCSKGNLKGFLKFFKDFNLKGGEMLLFEYYGRYDLNVYIIGSHCSEIEYPHIVHHLQTCHPRIVTLGNGGWRFIWFVDPSSSLVDEIEPPTPFIERCGSTFPRWPEIALKNGKVFCGSYSRETGKISCLRSMCDVLGVADLKPFYMLLFTYNGVGVVSVSVFDENLCEVLYPGSDESVDGLDRASSFQITIQPCHMLSYCYGVDISTQYKDLCNRLDRIDYIKVKYGDIFWRLQVKKRSDRKRTTINGGWVQFRDGLGLSVGDICSFACCSESYSIFTVVLLFHFAVRLNDGEEVMHVGQTSRQRVDLPASYASDTSKFLDDTAASLDGHSKDFVDKVEGMIKEIDEQSAIWKGKVTEMKKQAEHITDQRRTLAGQLLDFKNNI